MPTSTYQFKLVVVGEQGESPASAEATVDTAVRIRVATLGTSTEHCLRRVLSVELASYCLGSLVCCNARHLTSLH
jgi:hypothetical protein